MTLSFAHGLNSQALSDLVAYFSQPATRLSLGISDDAQAELHILGRRADREIVLMTVEARKLVVEVVMQGPSSKPATRMAHEFAVLETLEAFRVAPAPLMIDLSGRKAPFPLMVREYIEGPRLTSPNDLVQAIEALSSLHAVPVVQGEALPVIASPLIASMERAGEVIEKYLDHPYADPVSRSVLGSVLQQVHDRATSDEETLLAGPQVITHGRASINKVVATNDTVRVLQLVDAARDHPSRDLCRLLSPMYFASRGQILDADTQKAALDAYQRSMPISLAASHLLDLVTLRFPYVLLQDVAEVVSVWLSEQTGDPDNNEFAWPDLRLDDCLSPGFLRNLFIPYFDL